MALYFQRRSSFFFIVFFSANESKNQKRGRKNKSMFPEVWEQDWQRSRSTCMFIAAWRTWAADILSSSLNCVPELKLVYCGTTRSVYVFVHLVRYFNRRASFLPKEMFL